MSIKQRLCRLEQAAPRPRAEPEPMGAGELAAGMPGYGYGYLQEFEIVVLGGPGLMYAGPFNGHDAPDMWWMDVMDGLEP